MGDRGERFIDRPEVALEGRTAVDIERGPDLPSETLERDPFTVEPAVSVLKAVHGYLRTLLKNSLIPAG
jgi:hypothetical protein